MNVMRSSVSDITDCYSNSDHGHNVLYVYTWRLVDCIHVEIH